MPNEPTIQDTDWCWGGCRVSK